MSSNRTPLTIRALATIPLAAGLLLCSTATAGSAFGATPVHSSGTRIGITAKGTRLGVIAGSSSGARSALVTETNAMKSLETLTHFTATRHRAKARRRTSLRHTVKYAATASGKTSATQLAGVSVTAPTAAVASSPVALSPFEARLVSLINQARTAAGLHALTVVAGATDVARRWAAEMASGDALSHNSDLVTDLQNAGSEDWTMAAENVGEGCPTDADGLFAAYMASPHHRANILSASATDLGIGAIAVSEPEGDVIYNTMDFTNSYSNAYGAPKTSVVSDEVDPSDALADVG